MRQVFVNAVDADGSPLSLAVENGAITAIGTGSMLGKQAETVDLGGQLVLPCFTDGHVHLDKSFVGDGRWHPYQPVTRFRERLAVEKRELADAAPIKARAEALIRRAAGYGTIAMRSHVDVDATVGLTHLHAVMDACEAMRDAMTVQLVAFPQAGVLSCPGTADVLDAALREGAGVVGGIDPTTLDGNPDGQLDIVFGLAEKHDAMIDIHLHEPGDIGVADLGRIADRTVAAGLQGHVAVSHAYALGEVDEATLDTIAARLARAGVAIMTNAPGDRPFPPVLQLREAGVRVFVGNDNIQDAWWPYGNGDMLQRLMLLGYRSGFYTDDDLQMALALGTSESAAALGLNKPGLVPGQPADFIVIDAPNAAAAIATTPSARRIVRRGAFVACEG